MPTVSSISFSVKFDLTSVNTLVLTDATTYPSGAIGIYTVTQPDGGVRAGSFSSPDVTASGGVFSTTLRLSSTGTVQCGQYTIVYQIRTTDLVVTTFTRTFQMTYQPVSLTMREEFDVFTPKLEYYDDTVYQVSNYNNGSVTRAWSVVSTPTGTLTGSGAFIDMDYGGSYYDANYSVTLSSSLLYTHQVYTWLTVNETVSKTVLTYAETPPSYEEIVSLISDLRSYQESLTNTCQPFQNVKAGFEYAQTLLNHIVDKINTDDTGGIYVDLVELISVLHNNNIPTYSPANAVILPYVLPVIGGGGGSFSATIGDGSSTSYTVTHGLNSLDVLVELYEVSSGDTVYTNVERTGLNTILLSFSSLAIPTTNQYKVIIKK